ncbi:MAG: endolytic transglycosylase MltG [Sedimentibacter sp.]|uniref:endolytic transglycosylase MltG n=1 Tax=Sedimentibacter sp. TaxID=1960295 RepID=UPI003157FB0D
MRKIIAVLLVAIIAASAFMLMDNYMEENLEAVDMNDTAEIAVEIPSGSTTSDIAEILKENNLIKNIRVFKYHTEKTGADSRLKAGTYMLSRSMDADELLQALISGGDSGNTLNITVIEGLTLEEAAKSISEQTGLGYESLSAMMKDANYFRDDYEFLKDNPEIENLQGFLMPDTYNVYKNSSEEDIIRVLLSQFDDYYTAEIKPKLENAKLDFTDTMILASIVEKEALLDEERDEVAAVFLNRLDINMKLQSCATVNYAQGEWKERLTYDDIAIDSPYNTYVVYGLPPAAINSPGRVSINAVLEPADADYLFFVAKGDGSHYFSKTYDEHIKAANEYLQ